MNTKQLRQKILDLAIRGKLVPQDPNDEPASVLLERIKAEKEQLIKEGKIKRGKKSTSTSDKPHYPFEIPNGWCWVTLAEISNYGCCTNVAIDDIPNDAWILELEDLEKDSARILQRLTKSERQIKGVRHSFKKGNVLYSKLRTYLNKVLVADKDGSCTTEIIPFSLYGGICAKYISFVLRSKYFVDYAIQCGYGVKMPRLSTTDAHNGLIPLPPLKEQLRIVRAIEEYICTIDMIDNDKVELLSLSSNLKNKILQFAISGKLVPQDPADEPAEELLRRINPSAVPADKSHYDLPDSYCVVTLKDICKIISAKPFQIAQKQIQSKGKYPVVSQSANFIEGYTDSGCAYKIKTPIILFGDHTRNVKFIDFDFVVGADGTKLLLPLVLPQYVYLSTIYASNTIQNRGYSRHFSYLCKVSIPLPPLNEQKRIVAKVDELFALIDTIQQSLE